MDNPKLDEFKKKARKLEIMGVIVITLNAVLVLINLIQGDYISVINHLVIVILITLMLWNARIDLKMWELV